MRTFEHFPDTATCPICGTNKDGECRLIGIDGTGDGSIEQAQPIHVECLKGAGWRYKKEVDAIYCWAGWGKE